MKLEDLKNGNIVVTRDGEKYIFNYIEGKPYFICLNGAGFNPFKYYKDDLTIGNSLYSFLNSNIECDIMKVYKDYTLQELLWKRKEPIKLSKDEKVILRNIDKTRNDKNYKYIARLKSGTLAIFKSKPEKFSDEWFSYGGIIFPYSHLFQFIKWEDEEPYSIEELLREEVGE